MPRDDSRRCIREVLHLRTCLSNSTFLVHFHRTMARLCRGQISSSSSCFSMYAITRRLARFTDSLTISIKFVDNSFFFRSFAAIRRSEIRRVSQHFQFFQFYTVSFHEKTLFVVILLAHRWWLFDRCKKIILRLLDRSTHWSLLTLDMEQLTFNKIDSTYVSIIKLLEKGGFHHFLYMKRWIITELYNYI